MLPRMTRKGGGGGRANTDVGRKKGRGSGNAVIGWNVLCTAPIVDRLSIFFKYTVLSLIKRKLILKKSLNCAAWAIVKFSYSVRSVRAGADRAKWYFPVCTGTLCCTHIFLLRPGIRIKGNLSGSKNILYFDEELYFSFCCWHFDYTWSTGANKSPKCETRLIQIICWQLKWYVLHLNPVLLRQGYDDVVCMTVEVSAGLTRIRCVVGYGPQSSDKT